MDASVRSIAEGAGGESSFGEYQVGVPLLRNPGVYWVASSSRWWRVLSDVREPRKVALRLKSPPITKGRFVDDSCVAWALMVLINCILAFADLSVHLRYTEQRISC